MKLWQYLRGHKLNGLSFRRQHPVGPFIVDFACPSRLLIVELDGSIHDLSKEQDIDRDRILSEFGWFVMRFRNQDVATNLTDVLEQIALEANSRIAVFGRGENGARTND
jgi:very-short-patch-repair endonuclease